MLSFLAWLDDLTCDATGMPHVYVRARACVHARNYLHSSSCLDWVDLRVLSALYTVYQRAKGQEFAIANF